MNPCTDPAPGRNLPRGVPLETHISITPNPDQTLPHYSAPLLPLPDLRPDPRTDPVTVLPVDSLPVPWLLPPYRSI